jgi:membrane protease YdiL (CAAX protease family)
MPAEIAAPPTDRTPSPVHDPAEAAALALVVALNVLDNRAPARARLPVMLGGAAAAVALARVAGCTIPGQGLQPQGALAGMWFGIRAGASVAAAAAVFSLTPQGRRTADRRIVALPAGALWYEALVRAPLATAAGEEAIFRGALLALFARRRSATRAAVLASLAFGAWHAIPAYDRYAANAHGRRRFSTAAAHVAISIAATSVAGLAFTWLRWRSGSVAAPAVVHALANATGIIASWLVARRIDRSGHAANSIAPALGPTNAS